MCTAGRGGWADAITLVRKSGAFAGHAFRDLIIPGIVWRRWHERPISRFGDSARTGEYLPGLRLAPNERMERMESNLDCGSQK